MSSMDGSPNLTPAGRNCGTRIDAPVGFGISRDNRSLDEAKGFFRPEVLCRFLVAVIHGSVSCLFMFRRANHTSSYGLIYARSRLRLDRLCRNGGRAGFFP